MFWTVSGIFCRKLVQSLSKIVKFWIKFVDVLFPKPKITTLKTQAGEGQDVVVSLNIHFVMFVAKTYLQVFFCNPYCVTQILIWCQKVLPGNSYCHLCQTDLWNILNPYHTIFVARTYIHVVFGNSYQVSQSASCDFPQRSRMIDWKPDWCVQNGKHCAWPAVSKLFLLTCINNFASIPPLWSILIDVG